MLKIILISLFCFSPLVHADSETEADLKFIELRLTNLGRRVQNLKFEDSNKVAFKNAMEYITPRSSLEGSNIHYYLVSFSDNDINYTCLATFRDDPIRFTGYLTKLVGLSQCKIDVLASEQPVAKCFWGHCF